jgi:hypothetical protein
MTTLDICTDITDDQRMALRYAIERTGAAIEGYYDGTFQVALPNTGSPRKALRDLGLVPVPGSSHLFPLGSDAPPDHLRHAGKYPGSKGFWHFERYAVTPETPLPC